MALLQRLPAEVVGELCAWLTASEQCSLRLSCKSLCVSIPPNSLFSCIKINFPFPEDKSSRFALSRIASHCSSLLLNATHDGDECDDFYTPSNDDSITVWVKEFTAVHSVHCTFDYSFCGDGIPRILQVLKELPFPENVESMLVEPYTECYGSDLRLSHAFIPHIFRFPNLSSIVLAYVDDFSIVLDVFKTWPDLKELHVSQDSEDRVALDPFDGSSMRLNCLEKLVIFGYTCSEHTLKFMNSFKTATTPHSSSGVSTLKYLYFFLEEESDAYSIAAGSFIDVGHLSPNDFKQRVLNLFPNTLVQVRTNVGVGDYLLNDDYAVDIFWKRK